MAKTQISDVIVPEVFENYVIERTASMANFVRSGIIENDPTFDEKASGGGEMVNMPFWQDLALGRQILSDSGSLNTNKIGASRDVARIHDDGNAWSTNTLAKWLAGSDPMAAIGDLLGEYWAREDETMLISALKGVFGAASMSGNLLNIGTQDTTTYTSATKLNGDTFIDAKLLLGDVSDRLVAVAMHSATEGALLKLDLIDYLPDSEGKPTLKSFQGRTVHVDDDLPKVAGSTSGFVYTTYLFGPGAFAKGSARLNTPIEGGFGTEAVELARTALAHDTSLINRRRYILHPRGVKWTEDTVAGVSPTNAELETAANWVRVYEARNVRLVAIKHNN